MKRRPIPHEITLVAFTREGGLLSVLDIVETSRHFASHFTRKWVKAPDVAQFFACAPGQHNKMKVQS